MVCIKRVENLEEFTRDNATHIEQHYKEFSSTFSGNSKLDIDINTYQKLSDMGYANIFSIEDENNFIGYVSVSIAPCLLFKGVVDAVIDHLYFTKESRGKGLLKEVLSQIEDFFKKLGISRINISLPCSDKHKHFAEKLGFTVQSIIAVKNLGE